MARKSVCHVEIYLFAGGWWGNKKDFLRKHSSTAKHKHTNIHPRTIRYDKDVTLLVSVSVSAIELSPGPRRRRVRLAALTEWHLIERFVWASHKCVCIRYEADKWLRKGRRPPRVRTTHFQGAASEKGMDGIQVPSSDFLNMLDYIHKSAASPTSDFIE